MSPKTPESSGEIPHQQESNKGKQPLPVELQIATMKQLVVINCPVITLRHRQHLDSIMSRLIKVSKVQDKLNDNICKMLEDAIWTTATIKPDVTPERDQGKGSRMYFKLVMLATDLASQIRNLELSIGLIMPKDNNSIFYQSLVDVAKVPEAMHSLKSLFPRVIKLTLYMSVDVSDISDKHDESCSCATSVFT